MRRDDVEQIESLVRILREHLGRIDPPVIMLEGDEDSVYIRGNQAAYIRLAAESLEAARGNGQIFEGEGICGTEQTFRLKGLLYDNDPEVVPPVQAPWWGRIVVYLIVVAVGTTFFAGVVTLGSWVARHF